MATDDYYSPEMIDRWLRQWPLLCSLAEAAAIQNGWNEDRCLLNEAICPKGG